MRSAGGSVWISANGVVLADLVPRRLREQWTASGLCPGRDLYTLFSEHVRTAPGREAVVDESGALGYAALDVRVRRAAAALSAAGLGTADIIGVLLPNGRDAVVAELAVAAIGAVALPVPDTRAPRDVVALLGRSRAAALITTTETAAAAGAWRRGLPYLRELWTFGPSASGARDLDRPGDGEIWRPARPDPEGPARILVSSGSEGEPTMVAYSHNAMGGGRGNYLEALRLGADPMRILLLVSLASSFGSCGTSVTLARHGGTLVLLPRFDPAAALRAIDRHRPTHVFGVPTMLRRMADLDGLADVDLSSLLAVIASGAPLRQDERDVCVRRFGRPVINVYGSTDGVNCHTGRDPDRWHPGLAGRPDPAVCELTVRDHAGRPVPAGETGEIWALGPMTPLCHVAAPELDDRNRAVGGWVRTGDLGRLDADGALWVVGRSRRVVIRGGMKISPVRVERELGAHPDLADVYCVPVPDPDLGERMCACVATRNGMPPPTPAALTAYLRDERGLEPRELPERYLALPELPLGPTGKVCADTLARMAAESAVPVRSVPLQATAPAADHPVVPTEEPPMQPTAQQPTTADGADASRYVFDNHSEHARDQHTALARAYDPVTTARLDQAGVGPGWRCLEVGAGGGSVATWLAERVGPTGAVVATDIKPERIPGVPGLRILRHDIVRDPLPEAAFDLVHARLVLLHLPERIAVLNRLVRALKPGGVLQLDEFDITYGPGLLMPDPAARRLYETFLSAKIRLMERAGADVAWGRAVAEAMRDAGLVDIDPRPRLELWTADSPGVHLISHHTRHLRDRFVEEGMTDRQLADVRALLADPGFRATSCVFYSVQGRRPAG
ncbi:AMP-binding protein [Sphaerimonospora sp. CA-214678]|uniref:AMP-binding protein n=1 Tax=Sphaerimonospora sp. CA-214678 TaxID=3240029 RepID=UPI003D8A438B